MRSIHLLPFALVLVAGCAAESASPEEETSFSAESALGRDRVRYEGAVEALGGRYVVALTLDTPRAVRGTQKVHCWAWRSNGGACTTHFASPEGRPEATVTLELRDEAGVILASTSNRSALHPSGWMSDADVATYFLKPNAPPKSRIDHPVGVDGVVAEISEGRRLFVAQGYGRPSAIGFRVTSSFSTTSRSYVPSFSSDSRTSDHAFVGVLGGVQAPAEIAIQASLGRDARDLIGDRLPVVLRRVD
jgi:hypothetical protein